MNEKEFYISRITEMIASISNLEWLVKIYSFVKVFANDSEDCCESSRRSCLIGLVCKLSDESIERLNNLAQYLYIYKEQV
ncbi:MAG: hypothetical protein K2G55_14340 [Lachnospiraceae bacterium]|nr:hypothetical protein [Lachnospiraceae bacterium]MDE7205184.1 hypothetical protein [Lachnospiraceae bacterium]